MKPQVFIGSSQEGLAIAEAVQQSLDYIAYCDIWTDDIFKISATALDSLLKALPKFDFAIFILSPDDKVLSRDKEFTTVRDNIIYEMGLFTGRLGIEKVFMLKPRGVDLKLPSDLLGISSGTYDESNTNKVSAVRSFATSIKQQIHSLFTVEFPESGTYGKNILNEKVTVLNKGEQYQTRVIKPADVRIEVKTIRHEGFLGIQLGSQDNIKTISLTKDHKEQLYIVSGTDGELAHGEVSGKGIVEIEVRKEGSPNILLSKTITWDC